MVAASSESRSSCSSNSQQQHQEKRRKQYGAVGVSVLPILHRTAITLFISGSHTCEMYAKCIRNAHRTHISSKGPPLPLSLAPRPRGKQRTGARKRRPVRNGILSLGLGLCFLAPGVHAPPCRYMSCLGSLAYTRYGVRISIYIRLPRSL